MFYTLKRKIDILYISTFLSIIKYENINIFAYRFSYTIKNKLM